jgi:hypothetical protein
MAMNEAQIAEYETKSLKTKLKDLNRELSDSKNAKHRELLLRVHRSLRQLASDRNVAFHGLWGRFLNRQSEWRVASKSHSREDPFYADDLKALHERMIGAAEALDDAWYALGIAPGQQPKNRNRKQLWAPKATPMTNLPDFPRFVR